MIIEIKRSELHVVLFISLFYFHFTVIYIFCCIILRLMRKTCQKSNVLIIEETEKKHTSNERYNEEESV